MPHARLPHGPLLLRRRCLPTTTFLVSLFYLKSLCPLVHTYLPYHTHTFHFLSYSTLFILIHMHTYTFPGDWGQGQLSSILPFDPAHTHTHTFTYLPRLPFTHHTILPAVSTHTCHTCSLYTHTLTTMPPLLQRFVCSCQTTQCLTTPVAPYTLSPYFPHFFVPCPLPTCTHVPTFSTPPFPTTLYLYSPGGYLPTYHLLFDIVCMPLLFSRFCSPVLGSCPGTPFSTCRLYVSACCCHLPPPPPHTATCILHTCCVFYYHTTTCTTCLGLTTVCLLSVMPPTTCLLPGPCSPHHILPACTPLPVLVQFLPPFPAYTQFRSLLGLYTVSAIPHHRFPSFLLPHLRFRPCG